jgi:hypothetical protein
MDGYGNLWCEMRSMMFAIKAEVSDPWAETFAFSAQKTMYGGKHIAKGDTIFVFASENLMTDLENLELELIDPRN